MSGTENTRIRRQYAYGTRIRVTLWDEKSRVENLGSQLTGYFVFCQLVVDLRPDNGNAFVSPFRGPIKPSHIAQSPQKWFRKYC
jgi:hypothetical protein